MRPVRMKIKGFSAFRDEQDISFEDMDVFAVWGPTGAGKSSLLDALTYALYGKIPRFGERGAVQFVSQGQPRMTVHLEFDVGGRRYRVTRSHKGDGKGGKGLLERLDGDEWVSGGEGADRLTQIDRMVQGLIGLDYQAFTRSVVLPQGRFEEFLVGDASERRQILTELLGLELFRRMAGRAGEISREAKHRYEALRDVVEREYAGVDEAAVEEAAAAAAALVERCEAASRAESELEGLATEWEEETRAARTLEATVREIDEVSVALEEAVGSLARLRERAEGAAAERAVAEEALRDRRANLDRAIAARQEAEARWGNPDTLVDTLAAAKSLADAMAEEEAAASAHSTAVARRADAEARVTTAKEHEDAASRVLIDAERAHAAAREQHEAAHRTDLVATLIDGLQTGAPCPVCERPLEHLPAADAAVLEAARVELSSAETALKRAERDASKADGERKLGEEGLARVLEEVAEREAEVARRAAARSRLAATLQGRFPEGLPDDPVAELGTRVQRTRQLVANEGAARTALDAAERSLDEIDRAAGSIDAEAREIAGSIRAAGVGVLKRVGEAAPGVDLPDVLSPPLPTDPAELEDVARSAAKQMRTLSETVSGLVDARRRESARIAEDARRVAERVVDDDLTALPDIQRAVRTVCMSAERDRALAERRVADLRDRLENRRAKESEADELRGRHQVYQSLWSELRGDRLMAFLQEEALRVLAASGSDRLEYLSQGRYRLAFERDEFSVVDVWNGEERRSVRTLSGGETFLASLALALALSEQVQSLAVTEKARLDSLFLDEGFGTLDAETLEMVVGAIEQLGGDGRMVGVITHVWELAERMPVRIDVEKSPRGSRVRRSDAA